MAALAAAFLAGWIARAPERAMPEVVVRWVRGPTRTREVVSRADRPTATCLADDEVGIALLGLPDDVALGPPATESACRARIELAAALATARQLDEMGRPRAFPDDLPERYREATVVAVAQRVERACPHVDLRRIDCAEAPCLALFVRPAGTSGAVACPAWREAWPDESTTSSDGVLVRPDGERLAYELVGPRIPDELLPPDPAPRDERPFVWGDNGMKRLLQRGAEARDDLIGELGARELTFDEQQADELQFWRDLAEAGDEGAAQVLELLEQ